MAEQHGGVDAIAAVPVETIRDKLRQTMVLGLPDDDALKPTFYFERQIEWDKHDRESNPWDWSAAPLSDTTASPVQPICAYEFFSPLGRQGAAYTEVGEFNPTTVVFTMFEDDYKSIAGFSYATIGPGSQKWYFRYWRPSYGMGALTVYQIHCVAETV